MLHKYLHNKASEIIYCSHTAYTASIFSFLTAILFFNEEVSIYNLSAFGLLTVGILYHQKDQLKDFKLNKEILLSLLCAFFWGVSFVLYLIPIKSM